MNNVDTIEFNRDRPVAPPTSEFLDWVTETAIALRKHEDNINKALSYTEGTHTFNDIVNLVFNNLAVIWDLGDSFVILEINTYPQEKHLHVFLGAGSLDDILPIQKRLENYAQSAGCSRITMSGRRG